MMPEWEYCVTHVDTTNSAAKISEALKTANTTATHGADIECIEPRDRVHGAGHIAGLTRWRRAVNRRRRL